MARFNVRVEFPLTSGNIRATTKDKFWKKICVARDCIILELNLP